MTILSPWGRTSPPLEVVEDPGVELDVPPPQEASSTAAANGSNDFFFMDFLLLSFDGAIGKALNVIFMKQRGDEDEREGDEDGRGILRLNDRSIDNRARGSRPVDGLHIRKHLPEDVLSTP